MAGKKEPLADKQAMTKMDLAKPDPRKNAAAQADAKTDVRQTGIDDQDPLSAHPS